MSSKSLRSRTGERSRRPGSARRAFGSACIAAVAVIGTGVTVLALPQGAAVASTAKAASTASAPTATAAPTCPAPVDTTRPEQMATPTASYTASWNNINAVNDGTVIHTGGTNAQVWGSYAVSGRPASHWLQYTWTGSSTLTGATMSFWRDSASDTAGDGVAVPVSWKLQYLSSGTWIDIPLQGGAAYPRAKDAPNTVTFASPVTTTALRAVLNATTNGTTFAAMAVSEFGVSGTVAPSPTKGTEILTSPSFNVAISRATGGIYTLGNAGDAPNCTNYVLNPTSRPAYDVNDSRWVGDLEMRIDNTAVITSLSDDIRTVSRPDTNTVKVAYSGTAANTAGIRNGLGVDETYALTGANRDALKWTIQLNNNSAATKTVQDLGLPLLMNSFWDSSSQTKIYEQNVARHSFVAKDGSYAYWQRPNGKGPFLVMVPDEGTSLEFKNKVRPGGGTFAESDPAWEGLVNYYIRSANAGPAGVSAGNAGQYLAATSDTITAGSSKNYGFTFRWANDYVDLHNVLYESGVVDAVSYPGMTVPSDTTATVALRARSGIDSVVGGGGLSTAGNDTTITPAGTANGYNLYKIKFNSRGANFITVNYGGGRKSVMQYYSIAPIETLINAQADFIAAKQQAKNPARGYDGAYLQWDMKTKQMITRQNIASLALSTPDEFTLRWMTGGSDDLGLSPAAFLGAKNAITPNASQIASLDYYIDNFLLGYLQNQVVNGQRTWNVYHWYDGGDGARPSTGSESGDGWVGDGLATWRIMNVPHVWNTYFAMYQVAKLYPALTERTATDYLDMAFNTMKAYFLHTDAGVWLKDSSRDMASMGESTEPQVVAALQAEGRSAQATTLLGYMRAKYEVYASKAYPFASEASIDTTAFEGVYTLAKQFGDTALSNKVMSASMSARGTQPLWYYYGGDNRHMGESWWNLGYETHIGSLVQKNYLNDYDVAAQGFDFDESMRSTYGAYLAGWANINTGQISSDAANYGAASWQYQSELGTSMYSLIPNLNGWWAWSGESALGFWGALQTASTDVVNDGIVGLYGYGGDVTQSAGNFQVVPKDGVRQRLNMYNLNKFGLQLAGATYTGATIAGDLKAISLTLDSASAGGTTVALRNLPTGTYDVSVNGAAATQQFTSDGSSANVAINGLTAAANTLRITPHVAAPVDGTPPTVSAVTDPATANGANDWFTSAATVVLSATDETPGAVSVEYKLAGGDWTSYAGPITAPEGANTWSYRATDAAGNVSAPSTITLKRDATVPTVTASYDDEGGQADGPVSVTLTGADLTSGIDTISYSLDGGGWTTYTGPLQVPDAGTHQLAYRASDRAGNTSETGTASISIRGPDTTAPTVHATTDPSVATGSAGWFTGAVSLVITASDDRSAVNSVQYRFATGGWRDYTSPVSLVPGVHQVEYRASDAAGNLSQIQDLTIKRDVEAPSASATYDDGNGASEGPVSVAITATDDLSGVSSISHQVDGGGWSPYTRPIDVTGSGSHLVEFQATDGAGNVSVPDSVTVRVASPDTTAPVVSAETTPASATGLAGWFTGSVRAVLRATDDRSGVASIEYSLNNSAWELYSTPIVVPEGANSIRYRATDNKGNESAPVELTVRRDVTSPSSLASFDDQDGTAAGPVEVTLMASDVTSGVQRIRYSIDGAAEQDYVGPFEVGGTGAVIGYHAVDTAGNVEPERTATVRLVGSDTTAPEISYSVSPSAPNGASDWYTSAPEVTLLAADDRSGIAALEYSANGGDWQAYATPLFPSDGTTTYEFRATDGAGNEVRVSAAAIKLDSVSPSTTLTQTGSGVTGRPVSVSLAAADATSGVDAVNYRVDGGPWQTYDSAFQLTEPGSHVVEYAAADVAGNQEGTKSATLTVDVDRTPPTVVVETDPAPDGASGWYRTAPAVSAMAEDASGVASMQYRIGSGSWIAYAAGQAVTPAEGASTLYFRARDTEGNLSNAVPVRVMVDSVAPVSRATFNDHSGTATAPVAVTLTATDAAPASKVGSIAYNVDGGTWKVYNGVFQVGGAGVHVLQFAATDNAGNLEVAKTATVRIVEQDTSAPDLTLSTSPAVPNGSNGWYTSAVGVAAASTDVGSGVASVQYRAGSGAWKVYRGTIAAPVGFTTYTFKSTDMAGNVSATQELTVKVDTAKPTVTATRPSGRRGPIPVTVTARDAHSGVATVLYSLDGGDWSTYTEPVSVSGAGTHTVLVKSTDRAGNTSAVRTVTVKLDS